MTRSYKAEAVVLRRRNLGETDKILVMLTERRGKVSVVAKGARKPLSKFAGATEALNHLKLLVATGRNLDVLTQCEVKESFHHLRENLLGLATATYLAELVDAVVEEHEPLPEVYHLLLSSLYLLERAQAPADLVARRFEIQLMALIGYEPRLDECARCGADVEQGALAFSSSHGGVLCHACGELAATSFPLTRLALAGLRRLLTIDAPEIERARPKKELSAELARILKDYLRHHHDAPVKSLEFLETVEEAIQHGGRVLGPES